MLRSRIRFNTLPEHIAHAVMRVDEDAHIGSAWKLIHRSNTRRAYCYTDPVSQKQWFVKWGKTFTWRQFRHALLGRAEARVEWDNAKLAHGVGLPVIPYALLAVPQPYLGSVASLLVSDFLPNTVTAFEHLANNRSNPDRASVALRSIGAAMAEVHAHGFIHNDFTLRNILFPEGQPDSLKIVDWYRLQKSGSTGAEFFRTDIRFAIHDMVYLGLGRKLTYEFLDAYAERMPWADGKFDELYDLGRRFRVARCRKRYRECTRPSTRRPHLRHRGYRVFLLEGADRQRAVKQLEARLESGEPRSIEAEETWRIASALELGGVGGHRIMGYARPRWGGRRNGGWLLYDDEVRGVPVRERLTDDTHAESRRVLLREAGEFIRRLHELDMDLACISISLSTWYCSTREPPRAPFYTDDMEAFVLLTVFDDAPDFQWLGHLNVPGVGLDELRQFAKGYAFGESGIPYFRRLVRQIGGERNRSG